MPHIDAVEYPVSEDVWNIFAVPERNAVGTNSLHNAITVLDLSGSKVKYREIRRNFVKEASVGKMVFLPEFSRDTIGFSQTRGFLLFNVKTGEFRDQIVPRLLELTIQDVAVLDWDRKLFLFNLDFVPGETGREANLWVVDLSGSTPRRLAEYDIKNEPLWAELGKTTFFLARRDGRLVLNALDDMLRPTAHPLVTVYNGDSFPGEADLPIVHPTLPVALFTVKPRPGAGGYSVWAATWRDATRPVLYPVTTSLSGNFRYSPDGKWVLFWTFSNGSLAPGVMPVDANAPHFFGPPILLQTKEPVPNAWNGNCAWISDPVSVVCRVSRTEHISLTGEDKEVHKLLKWELSPANVKK